MFNVTTIVCNKHHRFKISIVNRVQLVCIFSCFIVFRLTFHCDQSYAVYKFNKNDITYTLHKHCREAFLARVIARRTPSQKSAHKTRHQLGRKSNTRRSHVCVSSIRRINYVQCQFWEAYLLRGIDRRTLKQHTHRSPVCVSSIRRPHLRPLCRSCPRQTRRDTGARASRDRLPRWPGPNHSKCAFVPQCQWRAIWGGARSGGTGPSWDPANFHLSKKKAWRGDDKIRKAYHNG